VSDLRPYLWLIPALPLAASIITGLLGPRWLRRQSHWPCILAGLGALVLSILVLRSIWKVEAEQAGLRFAQVPEEQRSAAEPQRTYLAADIEAYYTWFRIGFVNVPFVLRADALSAVMLVTVTLISLLIAIYSIGYMHGDEGYPRFFAEISLFIFSMTGLVLANNFLLLYAFWEGVGLCSYLLIGFWFTRPAAAAAARKAFLVTRLGDLGLILGIILIWTSFTVSGQTIHSLDFRTVFEVVRYGPFRGPLLAVCLLLFCGAVGKSAQFPLHVWLPDAMEGPSPVSALIHAATMVTAGVYLVARCMPLFREVPVALLVVACIGTFTALLAALIALTQNDLKRVLAYSTISQLGYMFLGLGSGTTTDLVAPAVIAGIFHLVTHAFFKALLFLSAGSVMHAMGNVIDMRRFGGLRRVLPITHATFLCGALALAGFPLLSGFWSKDDILALAWRAGKPTDPFGNYYMALLIIGLATAGLTAFYTFRAYFLTFWGAERLPPEAGEHAHESPPVMTVPLIILALGAVALGYIIGPATQWLSRFMYRTPLIVTSSQQPQHETNWILLALSSGLALAGIAGAAWVYVSKPGRADRMARDFGGMYQLSVNRFHLDELYAFFVVMPLAGLATFCRIIDLYVIDSLVDLVGQVPRLVGALFRPMQNGLVQFYALAMVLGLAVFLIALIRALAS
jgi:NADH-quinone oxidoreductase subunit L